MDLSVPISDFMTQKLVTANPKDTLRTVKSMFSENRIHHIPVVRYRTLVGLLSYSDFLLFTRGMHRSKYDEELEESRLENYCAEDIMVTDICTLEPIDKVEVAIEIFIENMFHAIPVLEHDELAGIITPIDVLKKLIANKD